MHSRMFNEEQKQEYINFEAKNQGSITRYFIRIASKETEYGKDLADMDRDQCVNTLKSLSVRRDESRRVLLSFLRSYVNWCILNGKTSNENIINQITPDSLGNVDNVAENMIGSPKHLNQILKDALDYENYENKSKMSELLFRLLYEGITLEEIQSFKKKDINYDTNEIKTIHGMTVKADDNLVRLWKECAALTFYEKKNGRAEASRSKNVNEYTKYDLVDNKYLFRTIITNKINENDMITLDALRKIILAIFTALERKTIPARNINYSGIFYKLYLLEKDGVDVTPEILAKYFRISYDENSQLSSITRKWKTDFKDWKIAFGYFGNQKKHKEGQPITNKPLRIVTSKANFMQWSADELANQDKNGTTDFNFALQRGSVWDPLRDSLLIHSTMIGIPIGEFYLNRLPDGIYEGLEGKQRKTGICNFINGLYELDPQTPPVELSDGTEYHVARHTFDELPNELQRKILMYPIRIWWYDNASHEEKIVFMERINGGKAATAIEKARYRVKSRNLFITLTKHQAISFIVREKEKKKLSDQDIVQDIWLISNVEKPSLLTKDRTPILEHTVVSDEQKDELIGAFDLMLSFYRAIESNKKLLSKVRSKPHIISLGYMGVLAVRNKIPEKKFIKNATGFFNAIISKTADGDDNATPVTGGSKPEQVHLRKEQLKKAILA